MRRSTVTSHHSFSFPVATDRTLRHHMTQTPSTGLRHPSFGGMCRKAVLGVCMWPWSKADPSNWGTLISASAVPNHWGIRIWKSDGATFDRSIEFCYAGENKQQNWTTLFKRLFDRLIGLGCRFEQRRWVDFVWNLNIDGALHRVVLCTVKRCCRFFGTLFSRNMHYVHGRSSNIITRWNVVF